MAATTRYNGSFGNYSTGTLRTVAQLKAFLITVKDDSNTAIGLTAEDADAAGEVDQLVEAIIREVQPLMYFTSAAGSANTIHVIVDGHAVDADTLQARVRAVVAGDQGHLAADNDSTVTLGTSITVA